MFGLREEGTRESNEDGRREQADTTQTRPTNPGLSAMGACCVETAPPLFGPVCDVANRVSRPRLRSFLLRLRAVPASPAAPTLACAAPWRRSSDSTNVLFDALCAANVSRYWPRLLINACMLVQDARRTCSSNPHAKPSFVRLTRRGLEPNGPNGPVFSQSFSSRLPGRVCTPCSLSGALSCTASLFMSVKYTSFSVN